MKRSLFHISRAPAKLGRFFPRKAEEDDLAYYTRVKRGSQRVTRICSVCLGLYLYAMFLAFPKNVAVVCIFTALIVPVMICNLYFHRLHNYAKQQTRERTGSSPEA